MDYSYNVLLNDERRVGHVIKSKIRDYNIIFYNQTRFRYSVG